MDDPAPSQTSSHFPLDPVSGLLLFEQETARRDGLKKQGLCRTGSKELDEQVLLGGFERGCIVGVSAEEDEMGLLVGLQTMAHLFVGSLRSASGPKPRAIIITTLSGSALLPVLRDVFKAQLAAQNEESGDVMGQVKGFLERISVSRVFDVAGLWEVIGELDTVEQAEEGVFPEPPSSQQQQQQEQQEQEQEVKVEEMVVDEAILVEATEPASSPLSDPPSSLAEELEFEEDGRAPTPPELARKTEIQDSDDEGDFSSPLTPAKSSPKPASPEKPQPALPPQDEITTSVAAIHNDPDVQNEFPHNETTPKTTDTHKDSTRPDIILITHMSTLLTALFHHREKATAHQTLQLLSSHLRYLTRSPDHGGPLVLILNSTTSPETPTREPANAPPDPTKKAPDPTLRSIFNPPPLPVSGLGYGYDTSLSRRNKPSFGQIFTQMLDLHLLCTRVPRSRGDAESLFAPPGSAVSAMSSMRRVEYAWVVEVLLDETGVWEGDGKGLGRSNGTGDDMRPRRSREQRWGAVDIKRDGKGVRIVDALKEIVVSGGFGGRRV